MTVTSVSRERGSDPVRGRWPMVAWFAAFAVFAVAVGLFSGQPVQKTWGVCAAGGYAVAALVAVSWWPRGRDAALSVAVAGALAAPVAWMATFGRGMSKVGEGSLAVVARSGVLLVRHGSPYLPPGQLTHVLAYDPYEPLMAVFGLPGAVGLHGATGNPRLWFGMTGGALLGLAFRIVRRGRVLPYTAFAFGSPVVALQLTVSGTDVPVLALLCLALASASDDPSLAPAFRFPSPLVVAGVAVGVACALKAIAWPALPVIAVLFARRDGVRLARRFTTISVITSVGCVVATAPAALAQPAVLLQNTVAFPLGLSRYKTPAASPLPGHLLAASGAAGHAAAIMLLAAAGLTVAASLLIWPPATVTGATLRLAAAMALMFTLAPASRWGYFVYPIGLCGWLWLCNPLSAARVHQDFDEVHAAASS
jgi:hypothetical protein